MPSQHPQKGVGHTGIQRTGVSKIRWGHLQSFHLQKHYNFTKLQHVKHHAQTYVDLKVVESIDNNRKSNQTFHRSLIHGFRKINK